jgi:hypothetical protein
MLKIKDNEVLKIIVKDYDLGLKNDIITNKPRYYTHQALGIDTWNDNVISPYNAHFSTYDLDFIYILTKEGALEYVED